jgi:cytidylate kinase
MASDDSGLNLQMFGNPDERRNSILFRAAKKVYNGEIIPPDSDDFASSDNLFNYQAKVLKELAQEESFVVIGRCADFILRDNPDVVSVFIHAPFDYCVDRGLEKQSMTRKEMEKYIQKTDKQKGDYYRYHTGQLWSDARNYDLCLDSSKLGFDGCVKAIKAYMAVRFSEQP